MNRVLPLALLVALVVLGAALTVLNTIDRTSEGIEVQLGVISAPGPKAQYLDSLILKAYEANALTAELKQRLEKPLKQAKLESFFLDSCEVSQKAYEQFLEWSLVQAADQTGELPTWMQSASSGHRIAGRLQSPATGLNQQAAMTYCEAAGGRLPYVEEMEVVANGAGRFLYPWGNEFTDALWPYASSDRNANQSCRSHSDLATETGAHHLVSNAMEWTLGTISLTGEQAQPIAFGAPASRGRSRDLYALNAAWYPVDREIRSHHLGFRCAYERVPPVLSWTLERPEFVYISAGTFEVGLPENARLPGFVVNMPDIRKLNLRQLIAEDGADRAKLKVDRCEVSRADFNSFLNDPMVKLGLLANENEPRDVDYTPLKWDKQLQDPNLPVFGVNWWAADAYARWAGGRLPSIQEWRQIALGPEGNRYPWGGTFGEPQPQVGDHADSSLKGCGEAQYDISNGGIRDLGGNLSEWTRSVTMNRGSVSMWVAGGNWILPGQETTQSVFGRSVPIGFQSETIGLRVVYD